jgi:hypothetical protein
MDKFEEQLRHHATHVEEMGIHCISEETTKQALILPLLNILDFTAHNPLKVQSEYLADFPGIKKTERVDYALFHNGQPVMYVEAKAYREKLGNHAPQLARYFNSTPGVRIAALTNGQIWKFFTDLKLENVMDDKPFFVVDFLDLKDSDIEELARFSYDHIQTESIRTFAEDQAYLAKFKEVIQTSLRELDPDFVKFVITKASPNLRMTQKIVDSMTPLVKRAVAEAMTGMVVNSLNLPPESSIVENEIEAVLHHEDDDIVDPCNSKIVTTKDERRLFEVAKTLLKIRLADTELVAKDTESYFAILFQGKNNRWLIRYNSNKKRPTIQFTVPLTEQYRLEIERAGLELSSGDHIYLDSPDDLLRVSGLLFDCFAYCANDENFKRAASSSTEAIIVA